MTLLTEGEDKITKAKTNLVLKHPFFAVVALSLLFRNAKENGMPFVTTMGTDGRHVWWDEEFVDSLTFQEIVGVVAHEVMHVVFLHFLRRGLRDPLLWNIACDHAVNHIVLDAGMTLPADRVFDIKYKDWLVDAIYDDLKKKEEDLRNKIKMDFPASGKGQGEGQPDQSQGQGDGQPEPSQGSGNQKTLWGITMEPTNDDGTPMSDADKSELMEEVKIKILQAAVAAKSAGKLPVALNGLIEAIKKPTVNWKEYIQNWVSGRTPDDYTWKRPNRKMLGLYNMLAPTMQLNGAGIGVISVDTSGSVSDAELVKYISEIAGVVEICNPEKVYIIDHDTKVNGCRVWEHGDDFKNLKISGRGGTNIKPSFKYAATKIDEEINWMICFTDMGIMDFPKASEAPDFPVLWAATGPDNAPFGTYLSLKDPIGAAS